MKKRIILLALMAFCMFGLTGCGEKVEKKGEVPSKERISEINHSIYDANQLDSLFSRHESVAYTFTFANDYENNGYVWETKDSIYQEWGSRQSEYVKDRIFYCMEYDSETDSLISRVGVDFIPDSPELYCIAGGSEGEFFDEDHDNVKDCYTEDKYLHMSSEFDNTLSKAWTEQFYGEDYKGKLISCDIIIDKDTYDISRITYSITQGGKKQVLSETIVEYDIPKPAACKNLCAAFERESENMLTLKYVVDPGTDREIKREITVPVNSEGGFRNGDVPYVYFNDADCNKLEHWDRLSDNTYYVFTYPSDELTEKFNKMLDEVMSKLNQ